MNGNKNEHSSFTPSKKIILLFDKALAVQSLMNNGELEGKEKLEYAGKLNKKLDSAWGAVYKKYKWMNEYSDKWSYDSTKKEIYKRYL